MQPWIHFEEEVSAAEEAQKTKGDKKVVEQLAMQSGPTIEYLRLAKHIGVNGIEK